MLVGKHFAKEEAYDIREAILERLCDICTKAGSYCWSIEAWYAMAERQERKRLLFLQKSGANMTNDQINRLHTLNTLYQTTPENNIPIL